MVVEGSLAVAVVVADAGVADAAGSVAAGFLDAGLAHARHCRQLTCPALMSGQYSYAWSVMRGSASYWYLCDV